MDQLEALGTATPTDFDFWVGTWDLRWRTPEGHPRAGTNVVTKTLGGAAILETFTDPVGPDGYGYHGLSVSTYDDDGGVWRQTWVDSAGNHYCFAGGPVDGGMNLSRRVLIDGADVMQRMTWRVLSPDALVWEWARSTDDGATWDLLWRIDYRRSAIC